jgi:peroxiredoxin
MASRPRPTLRALVQLGWCALLLSACGAPAPTPLAGSPAPAFTAQRLDGASVTWPADYGGRVVALRFWADWCRFCRDEMKAVEGVYGRHREAGLAVLALNVGQSQAVAERFTREIGVSYDVALDPEAAIAQRYGVTALPVTYFIDRQGRVRDRVLGEASAEVFERMARALIEEGP